MSPTCVVSPPHIRISDWGPGTGADFLTSGSQTGYIAYGAGPQVVQFPGPAGCQVEDPEEQN